MATRRPTDAELEILSLLWEHGPLTVRQVQEHMAADRRVGYTTALKLMQIMFEKELVERDESQRSHVYRAKIRREATQRNLVKDLVNRAFGGSTERLVLQALSAKKASAEELAEIRRLLDELEGGKS